MTKFIAIKAARRPTPDAADAPISNACAIISVFDGDARVREPFEALIVFAGSKSRAFATAKSFLPKLSATGPNCLVLDVNLPNLDGPNLQTRMVDDRVDMPILFVTGHEAVLSATRAMETGTDELLAKLFAENVLQDAIRATVVQSAERQSLRERYGTLSSREREVMARVVAGRLNKQVGADLGISENTVKAHRGQLMKKMKAASFADLVRMSVTLEGTAQPPTE